ncbi:MAG: LysR family transcriptional regulator [Myxococcota bacterium]
MDWDDVRHFLALARTGSVRAAGMQLGVSHSTVLRRVESLEEALSVRLFDRHRQGYSLTEAGTDMLPAAESVEHEMMSMERDLLGRDARLAGPVTVTCCDDWVANLLLRDLRGLCAEHPDIELCFVTDGRLFDLSKREADLAVRVIGLDGGPPEHLIGVKLAPLIMANYVAADAREVQPKRWVAFDDRKQAFAMAKASSYPDLPLWGSFASLRLMVQAIRQGFGLGKLPVYVGDQEPGLVRAAKPDLQHLATVWLLSHPDLRTNARIRALRMRVAAALRAHLPLFQGSFAPTGSEFAPPPTGKEPIG